MVGAGDGGGERWREWLLVVLFRAVFRTVVF